MDDSSDILFLLSVRMSPAWLKSLSTGTDDRTVVCLLDQRFYDYWVPPQLLKLMYLII